MGEPANDGGLPVIFLMGPTASGKTELAVSLATRLPLEIVSVDSALVYRGMDIGTAKPGPDVLARAPHRLLDIRDPAEAYSVAEFRADALAEIAVIHAAGRIPLLVGGTMLYFRALRDGLAEMPGADPAVRAEILELAATEGWSAVHRRLQEVDPETAARLRPTDSQRLQRALEVFELSGRGLSDWWRDQHDAGPLPYPLLQVGLVPGDRAMLHARIARRFEAMLDCGFEAEVRLLHGRADLHPGLPSVRAVGYRQMWAYLDGETGFDEMRQRALAATRQLAKRQLTWLRGWPGLLELDPEGADLHDRAFKIISDFIEPRP